MARVADWWPGGHGRAELIVWTEPADDYVDLESGHVEPPSGAEEQAGASPVAEERKAETRRRDFGR